MRELASQLFHAIDDFAQGCDFPEPQEDHALLLLIAGEALGMHLATVPGDDGRKSLMASVVVMICANRLLPLLIIVSVLWHRGLLALPRYRDPETYYYTVIRYSDDSAKSCLGQV